MKLWRAYLVCECEMPVVAETADEAYRIAQRFMGDEVRGSHPEWQLEGVSEVHNERELKAGDDFTDCWPWCATGTADAQAQTYIPKPEPGTPRGETAGEREEGR